MGKTKKLNKAEKIAIIFLREARRWEEQDIFVLEHWKKVHCAKSTSHRVLKYSKSTVLLKNKDKWMS